MTTAPRFYCEAGGTLIADRRPMEIEEAHSKAMAWWAKGLNCQRKGELRFARLYFSAAQELEDAVRECLKWRKASGPKDQRDWPESAA